MVRIGRQIPPETKIENPQKSQENGSDRTATLQIGPKLTFGQLEGHVTIHESRHEEGT
jgi:hypothetical protein